MSTTTPPIFSQEDYQQLLAARTKLGHALDVIQRANAAGIDVQEKEARRQEYDQILSLLEQHFFQEHKR